MGGPHTPIALAATATLNELSMGKSLSCHCQLVRGAGFQTSVSVALSETRGPTVVELGQQLPIPTGNTPAEELRPESEALIEVFSA